MLDLDLPHAARMASLYPATFLGLNHELGRIEPSYRADLVLVDAASTCSRPGSAAEPRAEPCLQDRCRSGAMLPLSRRRPDAR